MPRKRQPKTLRLNTLAEARDQVEINGEAYEIKLPRELSLGDHEELKRIRDGWSALPEDEVGQQEASLRLIYRMLAIAFYKEVSHEVLATLTTEHLTQLADFLSKRWEIP